MELSAIAHRAGSMHEKATTIRPEAQLVKTQTLSRTEDRKPGK